MRVALYMHAPQVGGAERYLGDLCQELAEQPGVQLHVLSPPGPLLPYLEQRLNGSAAIDRLAAAPLFGDGLAANVLRSGRAFRELRDALRRIEPDVLHINNGGYPGSHLARAGVFAARCPRVMTVNSRAQPRRGGSREVYRALDPLVWRALDRVIVPAGAAADDIVEKRHCPRELVTVIPYGIPEPAVDPTEVRRLREELAPEGQLLAGMVVAPSKDPAVAYKGHDVLLEAAERLNGRDVRLAIVGHDPGPAFAARIEALGLQGEITILPGFRETPPHMAAFDVLALPSTRSEALPLVALEAMAARTPVIGSRLAGIPEVVTDGMNGFTFAPGDADELARLLGLLARDRETLARLGDGALETYRKRFRSDEMAARTLAVYEQINGS